MSQSLIERLRTDAEEIRKDIYPRYKNPDELMNEAADVIERLLQERKPLTDEQIDAAWRSVDYTKPYEDFRMAVGRAIEAKVKDEQADMFWNSDDAERQHDSIDEFLNDEICNGDLEVGAVFTLWQAKRLPSVSIKVTSIDANECEAEYEIIEAAHGIKEQQ